MEKLSGIIIAVILTCLSFPLKSANASSLTDLKNLFDKYEVSVSEKDLFIIKDTYDF